MCRHIRTSTGQLLCSTSHDIKVFSVEETQAPAAIKRRGEKAFCKKCLKLYKESINTYKKGGEDC